MAIRSRLLRGDAPTPASPRCGAAEPASASAAASPASTRRSGWPNADCATSCCWRPQTLGARRLGPQWRLRVRRLLARRGASACRPGPARAKACTRHRRRGRPDPRAHPAPRDRLRATDAGVLWANWFRDPSCCRPPAHARRAFGRAWRLVPRAEFRELVRSERYRDALFEPNACISIRWLTRAASPRSAAERGRCAARALAGDRARRHGAGWRVTRRKAWWTREQVVLACGGYLAGLRREVDAGVLPIATYVMAPSRSASAWTRRCARLPRCTTRASPSTTTGRCPTRACCGAGASRCWTARPTPCALLLRDLLRVFPQLDGIGWSTPGPG